MTIIHVAFGLMVLAASSATSNSGGQQNLEWKKHYEVAKQSAQAAKRPLVVVIEDPTTEKLDEDSLSEDSRDILLKEDFELVRVNAATDYGKRVARAFGAKKLPYTAVTDEMSNRIVFRKAGRMSKTDWTLALAESVKTKGMVSAATEVVSQPAVVSQSAVEQLVVQSAPVQAAPVQQIYSQPTTVFKPVISQEMFAPNGMYVMPIGQQCVT